MARRLAREGFDIDLAFGNAKESAFVSVVRDAHVECKADQWCRKSGKVAIEIRQGGSEKGKGRLSGLSVTTAVWWAIGVDDDRWVFIRTSLLRPIVRAWMDKDGTAMLGDGNRFECVLVPVERLTRPLRGLA